VTSDDYRRTLETAIREYEALGQQRQDIDKRLAEVAQTISSLSRLCGLVPTVPMGLTDACRLIVRGAGLPVTPTEVRDRLGAFGFDLSRYSNDLAAIHTILKRLNQAGELRFIARGSDKPAYIWNRPPRAVALGPDIAAFMRESMHTHAPDETLTPRRRKKTTRTTK
jgi:hypothetical protein